jgi:hypothetical protein
MNFAKDSYYWKKGVRSFFIQTYPSAELRLAKLLLEISSPEYRLLK